MNHLHVPVIGLALAGLAGLAMGCVRGLRAETPALVGDAAPSAVRRRFGDVEIVAFHTGWVSVKEAHRTLSGLTATRMLAILGDGRWTEWMPVYAYAIVHPEGIWLVDAGLSEATLDFSDPGCDAPSRWIYEHLLRFRFEPQQRVDRQMAREGLDVARLRGVVLTHRHADHADALAALPEAARAYVGDGDWPAHAGALTCRWPAARVPSLVAANEDHPLSTDGRVRILPLPGHSPGHLGVTVDLGRAGFALLAGDACFDLGQVQSGTIAGISEEPEDARRSLALVREWIVRKPTFLLPAHDPVSVQRLRRGEATRLDD